MYYISIKDIASASQSDTEEFNKAVNLSDKESQEIHMAMAGGLEVTRQDEDGKSYKDTAYGIEAWAQYLETQNLDLRDRILDALLMDTTCKIEKQYNMHKLVNGLSNVEYKGSRWVGTAKPCARTLHDVHEDIASDSRYEGIETEIGTRKISKKHKEERLSTIN